MDFVSYMRNQNERLSSCDYVLHLWYELEEKCSGDIEANPESASDFNNHLPILLEEFWKTAVEKLNDGFMYEEMDENLKMYLIVLIYHCMTQFQDSVSNECIIHASELYLLLLITPQSDDFYKSKLYKSILNTLQTLLETKTCEQLVSKILQRLNNFLSRGKLSVSDLEVTLAALTQIIFTTSKEIFKNFNDDLPENVPVSRQALQCLKSIFIQETISTRKFVIITYLFNGLRKHNAVHLTPHIFNVIQINYRNLLKNLHPKFKEDHYKTFLNAFIHIWKHPEFSFYGEAVLIMNSLKEKHYRTLIDMLNKMMMTKNPHKNLFKLSLAIICFPPKYSPKEKVEVTNEILLRNILINCISTRHEVCSSAIESLAEILISPDMEKDFVKQPIIALLKHTEDNVINIPMILLGFKSLINKKWGSRSRNKHFFVIICSIMLISTEDHPHLYKEVLDILSEEVTPFDIKPFLPLLLETYIKLNNLEQKYSAILILKILFKMALHPMASSTEFVKSLYFPMISANMYKGTIQREILIGSIISEEFNFSEFFQKCHTLGLIKNEHVSRFLKDLQSIPESDLKLLCSIIHLTEYKELSVIANHINDNFMIVCTSSNIKYMFYIYNSILKNRNSITNSHRDLRNNEIVTHFIKHHLLEQNFHWNCVANAFALLKDLEKGTNLSEVFRRLKQEYDRKLKLSLQTQDSFLPLLYSSQLVIFAKMLPNDENLELMTNYLNLCADEIYRRSPQFNSKLWIGCLLIYTNICAIKTCLADKCLNFLRDALNSSLTSVKLAAINMTFDLCNMVTHSFEDLINYMFNQLIYGDISLKKSCLIKIDRLIRDDYLKLELEHFLIFVSLIADRNLVISDFLKQLLSENFLVSSTSTIAKYFVPLIVHMNGYKRHPTYQITADVHELIQVVSKNISNKRKIYSLLLTSLPIKVRFNIIYIIATNILDKMIKGTIKQDDGFWEMIKDSVFMYKLMTVNSNIEDSCEGFYKKVSTSISKFIVDKLDHQGERLYAEYSKEIKQATETLLKLLFFNDSDNVQKHIKLPVFDAIMWWTNFLLSEVVYLVHEEKCTEIQNYYIKVDAFFKKNGNTLRYTEECRSTNNFTFTTDASSSSIFNFSEAYIPHFSP